MTALDAWVPHLRCTVCGSEIERAYASVRCGAGHTFDIARQGYLNLGVSQRDARADSPAMVMAREAVQLAGVFDDVAQAVSHVTADHIGTHLGDPATDETRVIDLAGGTGFYLTQVLEALETPARGLVVELSAATLKRAAKAHPALAAVGADLTKAIPVASGCAHVVLSVFGPRNATEMRRILAPRGACIVVTPRADHLGELVNLVAMGPNAHHLSPTEIETRVAELVANAQSGTVAVAISVDVATFVAP